MAGKIKKMIDCIITQRGKGEPMLTSVIRTKLILKGIHPDKYTIDSPDLPPIIQKLEKLVLELGVRL